MPSPNKRTAKEIVQILNQHAPESAAESWDNVGLLVGSSTDTVERVVVSTDLDQAVVAAASRKKHSMIVVHHPVIFPKSKGLSRISPVDDQPGHLSTLNYQCIQRSIPIAVAHTNFDRCALEVPVAVSNALGIQPVGRLLDDSDTLMKLTVFVPESHLGKVREALGNVGAGKLGNYDQCAFQVSGEGCFRPLDGSSPFLGRTAQLEFVKESRLEMVYPKAIQAVVLEALRASHPYEEIAYDLIEMKNCPPVKGLIAGQGYGVYGDYQNLISFDAFLSRVKKGFHVQRLMVSKPEGRPRKIRRIAYTPGSGGAFMSSIMRLGCDVWVTGELGYHKAAELARAGITAIELGHPQSEYFFAPTIQKWLKAEGIPSVVMRSAWPEFV